jgi:chemotaxis protein methyltransferase CheR
MDRDRDTRSFGVIERESVGPQRFRGWIAQRLGLHFDDTKLEFLAEVLDRRVDKKGSMLSPYLDRLEGSDFTAELRALALELTVPETYFFRHIDQFHAFADVALPEAQATRGAIRKLSLLSVGCASGEEPYSLAMLVRERGAEQGWNVAIHAFDINSAMLAKAARGFYSAWALRETPAKSQQRWFRNVGKEFELEESIRAAVTFQEVNLVQENAELWALDKYDVIFCRNVLMYFTPQSAQELVARLTRSLAPRGHLFLGSAETLRGLSNDFHLRQTHGAFYYQRKHPKNDIRGKKCEDTLSDISQDKLAQQAVVRPVASVPEPAWTKNWLDTIQGASDRIQALTGRSTPKSTLPDGGGPAAEMQTAAQMPLVMELLKKERFSDALDLLRCLPAESEQDPDVLLLRAALLTHCGDLSAAETVCAQLLGQDELNTGAHYLLALCRESTGDRQCALDHYSSAIYLDPAFAMPRLHLGLMARRDGDREGAIRELSQALVLLKREDASRLLLFGGGFGREALIALCRAELVSARGVA